MAQLKILFPDGERTVATDGRANSQTLTDLLRHADLPLNTRCGQRGLCDGCFVDLCSGRVLPRDGGPPVSPDDQSPLALRACQHQLPAEGDAVVRVPARSLLAHKPQVVTSFSVNVTYAHDPLWQRLRLPDLEPHDGESFDVTLCRVVSQLREADLPVRADEKVTPRPIREEIESGAGQHEVVLEHRGDHWQLLPNLWRQPSYGVAVDIGTTTVVMLLVDLESGAVVGSSSALNGQTRLGDNVLTRINLCLTESRWVRRLQRALVRKTLFPLLEQLILEAGVSEDQVVAFVMSGNTTMLHLLAGVHPGSLGTSPFTPQFLDHRVLRRHHLLPPDFRDGKAAMETFQDAGASTGENLGPAIHLLPGAAAYVGADIVAGVLATGMVYQTEPCLLVDVGTNGEILLKHEDQLLGCATAAGPAFEGAGMTCGVRAQEGAISHVRLDSRLDQPEIEMIGGGKPIGICGTAYVDFLAQARRVGLIGATGRFREGWLTHPLLQECDHSRGFRLATGRGKEPIVVSESDIASLLQAKAAIAAGIVCLLDRVGLHSHDIHTLYLAGGFGFHMDIENVIRSGLLPGFHPEQIQMVGNTSLAGAYLSLLDSSVLAEIKRIAGRMEIVELNLEPKFESHYIDQLLLPESP